MQSLTCKPAVTVDSQAVAYRCAPAIVWVKDSGQTILVESENERYWIIRGVEAMVWDLLTLNYTFEGIVRFLSVMLKTPVDEATGALRAILQNWENAGILLPIRGDGRG
jgi:hypothetical protein